MNVTRREALSTLGVSALSLAAAGRGLDAAGPDQETRTAAAQYTLPPLPYAFNALEPHIDAQTMQIHHDKHHQAYVDNLNKALASAGAAGMAALDDLLKNVAVLPEAVRTAVRNNGGGHVNHVQFWTLLAPGAGGPPTGAIADAIAGAFGSVEAFKDQFSKAAMGRFGSGWAWLSDEKGKLVIHSTANQDTPSMEGKRAIFGLDVWEHAYYLKYQNRRADYVGAFWNVINWAEINKRLKA
jgi:Fe-Mn family superoxide dismutase